MDSVDEQLDLEVASEEPDAAEHHVNGEKETGTEDEHVVVSEENASLNENEIIEDPTAEQDGGEEENLEPAFPPREDDKEGEGEGGRSNERLTVFPQTRIKQIMKADPDVSLASSEAVVLLSKAAELFVIMMSRDVATKTLQNKRKTMQRRDIDILLDTKDCYYFLADTLDS